MNIYPFHISATDMGSWVASPSIAQLVWSRIRVDYPHVYCHAAECEVTEPGRITLQIRKMLDTTYGGIGDIILELEVSELTEMEQEILNHWILKEQTERAREELARRKEEEYNAEVEKVRLEMFGNH